MVYFWNIVAVDNHGASTTSYVCCFTTGMNHPPSAPIIKGPSSTPIIKSQLGSKPLPRPLPKPGTYNFTFKATDPDGDDLYYYIDWGDGTTSGWIGPYPSGEEITRSHTWSFKGTYLVRAKAKDIYGAEGPWGTLSVIMPLNLQSSQSSQQPSSLPSSQNVMSVIPSTGTTMIENQLTYGLVIFGPHQGYVGVEYIYTFRYPDFRLTDSEGWDFSLDVDWGDGTSTSWDGPYEYMIEGLNLPHTWYVSGVYTISARMFDGFDSYYATLEVPIFDNQIPYATIITGPVLVGPGPHEWMFGTIEPDGDNVSYEIFWGDGTNDSWIGAYNPYEEITRSHTYSEKRWFIIRARAKDIHGAIGDWGYFLVRFSKSAQQSSTSLNIQTQNSLLLQQMVKTNK
jgi:hypothetical protein